MRPIYPRTHRWHLDRRNPASQFKPVDNVPTDPQLFYRDLGLLRHPQTGLPVPKMTAYQEDVWRAGQFHKYRLVIKSQKIGLTTSVLDEVFQHALTDCKGYELIVLAQTLQHAREHLYTLRKRILSSQKYHGYLMTKYTEAVLRDEVTKVTALYIRNPDDSHRPTRIIGLGANEASLWSWKEVKFIHISDIAVVNKTDYSGVISAAMTRLATTSGSMIIESPPYGPSGKLYEIYKQSKLLKESKEQAPDSPESQFWVTTITAREAVAAGIIMQEFLDGERVRLAHLYPAYYEAEFMVGFGNLFLPETIDKCEQLGALHGTPDADNFNTNTPKALGIDYGEGSSDMAFVLLEYSNEVIRVLVAESFSRARFPDMVRFAHNLWDHYQLKRVGKIYVDASAPEYIAELKLSIGENSNYIPLIERYRQQKVNLNDTAMQVIPVPFSIYNDQMTMFTKSIIDSGKLAIHPDKFQNLILDLKNAATDDKGKLIKDQTNRMDLFDGLRMALRFFKMSPEQLKKPDSTGPYDNA
jgi:hypothetical protein